MKCRYETIDSKRCWGTKEIDPCPGYDKCKDYRPDCTNADRIRSMTDDQLHKFIVSLTYDGWTFACSNPPECDPAPENEHKCAECLKRWLQQPAEECE